MRFAAIILLLVLLLFCSPPATAATYTSVYPAEYSTDYVNTTTFVYSPWDTTNPAKSLTGTTNGNQWLSDSTKVTNQRFHINLSSGKIIRRVYYENSLNTGGIQTTRGAKYFTLWGSNSYSSFKSITYTNDEGWTQLNTSTTSLSQHIATDISDPKYILVENSEPYAFYAFKFANNYGDTDYMGVRRIELQTEDGYSPTDTTPPKSITGLTNVTPSCSNISWSWTNPTDTDYSHLYVMRNNVFLTNYTNSTTTALWNSLDEGTSYTFSSHTVDLTGNMNTTWVNQTVTTDYCPVTPTPTPTPTPSPTSAPAAGSPGARFDVNKTYAVIGEQIRFYDESFGNITDWNWSFGDGQYSTLQAATHTYSSLGLYSVSLWVNTSQFNVTSNMSYTKDNLITIGNAIITEAPTPAPTIPNLPAVPPNITLLDIVYGWWWLIVVALLVLWLGRR